MSPAAMAQAKLDGFLAVPVTADKCPATWVVLDSLLDTDPNLLGRGRDCRGHPAYDKLDLKCASRPFQRGCTPISRGEPSI